MSGQGVPVGDTDGDGLENIDELNTYSTDPFLADTDTDEDGVDDGGEVDLAALGFSNGADDSEKLALIRNHSPKLDLYKEEDVHDLAVDGPVIGRDPVSGKFHLTLGLQKTQNLQTWNPMTDYEATIDEPSGKLMIEIPADYGAPYFFRFHTVAPLSP